MNPLSDLVSVFQTFPGIGEKTAERLAFFTISLPSKQIKNMTETMRTTKERIRFCECCYNISFEEQCFICKDQQRNNDLLCVVAEPKDIIAIERAGIFTGVYHVLGGLISPLDNIHPETLRIKELKIKIQAKSFKEVILAINPTVEGDTTIMYLSKILNNSSITFSKLAHGLPMGADIDYTDQITLKNAIEGRQKITL